MASKKMKRSREQAKLSEVIEATANLDKSTVTSGINALYKVLEQKKKDNKQLLNTSSPIFLQVNSIKIPQCVSRTLRLSVKHPLYDEDSTVCFIVGDVKNIIKKEYEKVVDYYENYLSENGVTTKIDKIMPYHQLRNEYGEFELKRQLLCTYDLFLVDAKISKYVVRHLGKIFSSKRALPIPIRMERGMAKQIQYAKTKTAMNIHGHGNSFTVEVGNTSMSEKELRENVLEVCEELRKEFPGGWENIKCVNLKTDVSMAIPIYFSLRNPSEVEVPVIKSKRPKAFAPVTDELSTKRDKKVTVYPDGEVVM